MAANLRNALRSAKPLLTQSLKGAIERLTVTRSGQLINTVQVNNVGLIPRGNNEFSIDIDVDAKDYLVYVSEGTGSQSNDPSKSVDTSKKGIRPRNILDAWTSSPDFGEIINTVVDAYYSDYMANIDRTDAPAGVITGIFISGFDDEIKTV
jgi:hypothetical protein